MLKRSHTATALALGTLSLSLLAANSVRESYDLTPRFEKGQSLTITTEAMMTFELGDAEITVNGSPIPAVPAIQMEFTMEDGVEEQVLDAEDGAIRKLRRETTSNSVSIDGDVEMMGEAQTIAEWDESPQVGHVLELTVDEDGEIEVEDISEDSDLDELSEEDLLSMDVDNHGEQLLPTDEVEVGESWDVGDALHKDLMSSLERSIDDDVAEIIQILEMVGEEVEFEAQGTLVSVDDKGANIEWTAKMSIASLDLLEIMLEVAPEGEMDGFPEDAEATATMTFELIGKGLFDLNLHQLVELSIEGDYTLTIEAAASMDGQGGEVSAEFEGTLEATNTIEVE
ncbi:MAG: hypothetical protein ACI841_005208 [Planctomycetota bacterium]|jgi:hypothetical protein